MIEEAIKYKNKLKCAYHQQIANAYARGIEWDFTFQQWVIFWAASGKLHRRGCRHGQYVMGRFYDQGPYTIGNVKIILHSENVRESRLGKSPPIEAILKNQQWHLGRTHRQETKTKISQALVGIPKTVAHRNAMRGKRTPLS